MTRKKPKRRKLTDKERRAAAREEWDLKYGMPEILGHKAEQDSQPHPADQTMAPPDIQSLCDFCNDSPQRQEILENLYLLNCSDL